MMRKNQLFRLASAALALVGVTVHAQLFPLSENSWSNPEFVKRFLGSYAPLTDLEPQITSAEAEVFQRLATLLEANDTAGAVRLLQSSLRPESSAALDYTLGSLQLQQGRNAEATRHYREAIRKHPRFLRAYKNLGLAQVQEGNYEEARDLFIKALELGDKEGNTFGLLGYCYLNLNRFALARDTYALARVLNPGNRDWVIGYAQSLMQTGDYRTAIPIFEELIAQQPDQSQYFSVISNAYIALQEYDMAARYLEILRRMDRADAAAQLLLGDIYMNETLYELALGAYLGAYDARGNVTEQRSLQIANAFINRSAFDMAEAFIERFTRLRGEGLEESTAREFLNLRATIALARGESDEAAGILEEIIAEDPRNGRALILLGDYYAGDGADKVRAAYFYERAQTVDSVAREAAIQHARMRVRDREYEKAVELLEAAQSIRYENNVARYLEAVRRVLE